MPVTMYQLIIKGLPLYNIVERLQPGDICKINIKVNDVVLFFMDGMTYKKIYINMEITIIKI